MTTENKSNTKNLFFSLCDFFNLYELFSHYRPRVFKRMFLSSLHNLCAHIYVQQIKKKDLFSEHAHVMFFRKCPFCLFTIYACIYTGRLEFIQYTPFFLSFHKLCENMHVHVIYAWLHSCRIWNFIETVPWGITTWSVLGQLIVFFTTCDGCTFSAI